MKTTYAVLLLCVCMFACKGDRGPAGPVLTGDIAGKVRLYDEHAFQQLNDNSGVTVALDSTSISATSSRDGSWRLTDVPAGIYGFRFSKAGYFVRRDYNFQFVGNGTYYEYQLSLSQIPSVVAKTLAIAIDDTMRVITFSGTISRSDSLPLYVLILRSQSPFSGSSPCTFNDYFSIWIAPDSASYSDSFGSSWLYEKGTHEYAVAMVGNSLFPFSYNQTTGLAELSTPNVSFSNQVTFIDP